MGKYEPPLGRRGRSRGPVIDRLIEQKMERAMNAKQFVGFKITERGYLVVHYVVEDPQGQETLIKERLTSGQPGDLEALQERLMQMYLHQSGA